MSKYDEIMEHVNATDEIRTRVLANVDKYFEGKNKRARLSRYVYRFGAAAAAIIVIGGLALRYNQSLSPETGVGSGSDSTYETGGTEATGIFTVTDCKSAKELEDIVGFAAPELKKPPFDTESTAYTAIGDNIAQIIYYSKNDAAELVLRKAPGTEDISGDYNVYAENEELNIGEINVAVKGNDGLLYLAVWTDGKYSYSIYLSTGCERDAFAELLTELIG